MKKDIIINPDNLNDKEITNKRIINKYLIIDNNRLLFKMHHNTYYLLDEDDLKIKDKDIIMSKKEYIKDYPFFLENSLIITNYYLINEHISFENGFWIDEEHVKEVIENNRYDNPRNQNITNEIIEVLNLIK